VQFLTRGLIVCNALHVTVFQGQKMREARAAKRLTQEELADAAGVSRRSVIHAEKGEHVPGSEALARIAKVLERPIGDFFDENGVKP
jgi:transcriptional regulator with XRE-family HTH domain